jgi:hypothetical protein
MDLMKNGAGNEFHTFRMGVSVITYQLQISVKHNNSLQKIFVWQHVSTLLSHHQAFWITDPMYQIL